MPISGKPEIGSEDPAFAKILKALSTPPGFPLSRE
jgi:hypothetical protein